MTMIKGGGFGRLFPPPLFKLLKFHSMKTSDKKLDPAKSSVVGGGIKPTAKQRKVKFKRLLTQYSINQSKNQ